MAKTWLITGASRGFGRQLAEAVLDAGDQLVATARQPEQLDDLVAAHGERVQAVALDVTDAVAAEAAVKTAVEAFGGLDVVVNNAGYANSAPIEEMTEADFRAQVETNLFGVVNVTRAALPVLRKQRSGTFVQFSSIGGRVGGTPGMGAYQTAKFAVEGFSEVLANEVAPFSVRVIIVEPGAFRTDWATRSMKESDTPISDYADVAARKDLIKQFADHLPGDPRKVAEAVLMVTELDDPPLRLLLGRDVLKAMRDKIAATTASIDEWESVTKDVNFPSG